MPKHALIISTAITALIFISTAVYFFVTDDDPQIDQGQTAKQSGEKPVDPLISKVKSMTLEQKIGQMLIVGFASKYPDDHVRKMIKEYHIGGVNLLKRNVQDRNQVRKLAADLQKISAIPLFIAADQEGGKVVRFGFLNELTPQVRIKDIQAAEDIAFARAAELREIGVNMNFSPVLDYSPDKSAYIYGRTFGADPEITGDLGSAMLKGYLRGGIIPVAKHFPGYGNITLDPHVNPVTSPVEQNELEQSLIPFQKVIEKNPTVAIMTAHIVIPSMDMKPATLSAKFLTEILRKQLGFKGVIITDDMEMVSAGDSIEQSSVDALKAGADIIISTYTPEKQIRIFDRLKRAALDGEITQERINESVMRILALKSALAEFSP